MQLSNTKLTIVAQSNSFSPPAGKFITNSLTGFLFYLKEIYGKQLTKGTITFIRDPITARHIFLFLIHCFTHYQIHYLNFYNERVTKYTRLTDGSVWEMIKNY